MEQQQRSLDQTNQAFWNELCGSGLARALGVTDASPESLARYDAAYLGFYPYLTTYVEHAAVRGKRVLEIGLGYGTLGQLLATHAAGYYGVDISSGPVAMMDHRLRQMDVHGGTGVVQASALNLPFRDGSFDYVVSIGCLHHTGDLAQGIAEVRRVLSRGGQAVIMLYNRDSFRRLIHAPLSYVRRLWAATLSRPSLREFVRGLYDRDSSGEAAPHTDFVSRRAARRLFDGFSTVRVDIQNFDTYAFCRGRLVVPREKLLGSLGRLLGLDLYIVAKK